MKQFAIRLVSYLVFLFIAFWFVAFLIWIPGKILNTNEIEKSVFTLDILKIGTAGFATWWWVKWTKFEFTSRNQFDRTKHILPGLAVGLLSVTFAALFFLPFGWLQTKPDLGSIWEPLLISLSGSIAAGVGEEVIFRGVLYPLFRDVLPHRISALIVAVLFAITHLLLNHYNNPFLPPFYLIMGGLLFASAWELKGLWYSIGIHIGIDLAMGKIDLFTKNIAPSWALLDGGVSDWIPVLLVACVLFVQHRHKALSSHQANSI